MEKERKIKLIAISALIVAVLGLTIAFASLSQTLTINGTATLDAAKWGIKFENLSSGKVVGDAVINDTAMIAEDQITINNIDVSLKTPGDSVTYTVDLVNEGTINAEIYSIEVPKFTEEQEKYIDFKVTYDNGEEVKQGDILNKETKKNLTIKVEFKKDITESDLPKSGEEISLSYKLNFVQTDENDTTEGSGGTTDNYGDEIRSWNLSDTVKMTYYNGELQSDGTYDNGDLVISGTGAIPDVTTNEKGYPGSDAIMIKLADVSSFEELEMGEDGLPIFKYNPVNLIIEEGITKIGLGSFIYVLPISNITLSSTVTEIGQSAFGDCTSLTSINLQNVEVVGEQAFYGCSSLNTVEMPNVIKIEKHAFDSCNSLVNVSMPKVENIADYIFARCNSLRSINVPSSITSVSNYAFSWITSDGLTIYVPNNSVKEKLQATYDMIKVEIVVDSTKFE